jgi:hypothetical protein
MCTLSCLGDSTAATLDCKSSRSPPRVATRSPAIESTSTPRDSRMLVVPIAIACSFEIRPPLSIAALEDDESFVNKETESVRNYHLGTHPSNIERQITRRRSPLRTLASKAHGDIMLQQLNDGAILRKRRSWKTKRRIYESACFYRAKE